MHGFSLILSIIILASFQVAYGQQCEKLENEGRLIYQQFKNTKVCRESKIGRGWTDCEFRAYGTSVLLVGAIGTTVENRMQGNFGSGFHVLAVDKTMTVRVLFDSDFGTLLRVDGKDNLDEKSGCIYNEAFITLDAQVYGPGEFNQIKMGPISVPKTPEEKTIALQKDLKLLGYYKGEINGKLGAETLAAVERFKIDKKIQRSTTLEDTTGIITLDALSKNLDEVKRLYDEVASPKPPLKR